MAAMQAPSGCSLLQACHSAAECRCECLYSLSYYFVFPQPEHVLSSHTTPSRVSFQASSCFSQVDNIFFFWVTGIVPHCSYFSLITLFFSAQSGQDFFPLFLGALCTMADFSVNLLLFSYLYWSFGFHANKSELF